MDSQILTDVRLYVETESELKAIYRLILFGNNNVLVFDVWTVRNGAFVPDDWLID